MINDLPFKFPILTIADPNPEIDWERIDVHFSWDAFTNLGRYEREKRRQVGRLVMDVSGRSWRILDMRDLGVQANDPIDRFWSKVFGTHRVQYEISEELNLPLEEIQERACATVLANPDAWTDNEIFAGEGGLPAREPEDVLDELIANVRGAKSPLELLAVIDFHGKG